MYSQLAEYMSTMKRSVTSDNDGMADQTEEDVDFGNQSRLVELTASLYHESYDFSGLPSNALTFFNLGLK